MIDKAKAVGGSFSSPNSDHSKGFCRPFSKEANTLKTNPISKSDITADYGGICPSHQVNTPIETINGEIVCKNCGCVLGKDYSTGEKENNTKSIGPGRLEGQPISGMTTIGNVPRNSDEKIKYKCNILKNTEKFTHGYDESVYRKLNQDLGLLRNVFEIPDYIADGLKLLFMKNWKTYKFQGRTRRAVLGAFINLLGKTINKNWTVKSIAYILGISLSYLRKNIKFVQHLIAKDEYSHTIFNNYKILLLGRTPAKEDLDYIWKENLKAMFDIACTPLPQIECLRSAFYSLIQKCDRTWFSSRENVVTVAIIYYISKQTDYKMKLTQKSIADALDTTPNTMRLPLKILNNKGL